MKSVVDSVLIVVLSACAVPAVGDATERIGRTDFHRRLFFRGAGRISAVGLRIENLRWRDQTYYGKCRNDGAARVVYLAEVSARHELSESFEKVSRRASCP